jgi:hypothetical protein
MGERLTALQVKYSSDNGIGAYSGPLDYSWKRFLFRNRQIGRTFLQELKSRDSILMMRKISLHSVAATLWTQPIWQVDIEYSTYVDEVDLKVKNLPFLPGVLSAGSRGVLITPALYHTAPWPWRKHWKIQNNQGTRRIRTPNTTQKGVKFNLKFW